MTSTSTAPVAAEMTRRLQATLNPTAMELIDDSEAHRGHAGHDERGESHFSLTIESPSFIGKSRVEMQRMVHAALGDLLGDRVHALSIKASAPSG
jgi:BolA family transcriptional regulator, general stress-responsive regulator